MKEVKALMNYKDYTLNKDIKEGDDLVSMYNEANKVLDDERLQVLLNGNKTNGFRPFVVVKESKKEEPTKTQPKAMSDEIETADMKMGNVEVAIKPRRKKANKE